MSAHRRAGDDSRVLEAVYKALAEGMTQREVSALVQAAYAHVSDFPDTRA